MRNAERETEGNIDGYGYYDYLYEQSFEILKAWLERDPTERELSEHIQATIEEAQLEKAFRKRESKYD